MFVGNGDFLSNKKNPKSNNVNDVNDVIFDHEKRCFIDF